MDDLGVRGDFLLKTLDECDVRDDIDLFVAMGNEIAPTVKARGKRNIYHCQFPFPLHRVDGRNITFLDDYDEIIVNSGFTQHCTKAALQTYGRGHIPVHVIHPPVKLNSDASTATYHPDSFTVATLGRFITTEHMKRQDIVLQILNHLETHGVYPQGVIAGSLSTDETDVAFFEQLKTDAPAHISLEANISRQRITDILSRASIYIHATGFGISPAAQPHYMEHFGITIVEAMSHGCVPLVYDAGGAAEIVRDSGIGYTFTTIEGAVDKLKRYHALPEAERKKMAMKAFKAAQKYDESHFLTAWHAVAAAKAS